MDSSFAVLVHPVNAGEVLRRIKFMRGWSEPLAERILRSLPPLKLSGVAGVASSLAEAAGCSVSINLTSRQILTLPEKVVLQKITKAGKLAERTGARIVGLGGLISAVGNDGVNVARRLNIAVTSGKTYFVAAALEGMQKAAALMGLDLREARVAILGATEPTGNLCARILAGEGVNYLTLITKEQSRLEYLARRILFDSGVSCKITSQMGKATRDADVLIVAGSAGDGLIAPEDLKPGAVVCDLVRPGCVAAQIARCRDDVLVLEGGVIEIPGDSKSNHNSGFPSRVTCAATAETILLALEKRFVNFSLGRHLRLEKVNEIRRLAAKHGFKTSGFHVFNRYITDEEVRRIKGKARIKKEAGTGRQGVETGAAGL